MALPVEAAAPRSAPGNKHKYRTGGVKALAAHTTRRDARRVRERPMDKFPSLSLIGPFGRWRAARAARSFT